MRNGVQARAPATFEPRFRSGVPAKIEGVLAAVVGEVLGLGVENGLSGRGCVVRGC